MRNLEMLLITAVWFVIDTCLIAGVTPPQIAESWATQNYQQAIDNVLPGRFVENIPREVEWIVTIRILPAWDEESSIRLVHTWQGTTKVDFVVARKGSILSQMRCLKEKDPRTDLPATITRLDVERKTLAMAECPKLDELVHELEVTRFLAIPPNVLMVDATHYEFWIQNAYDGLVQVELTGPDVNAPGKIHELISWVDRLCTSCHLVMSKDR